MSTPFDSNEQSGGRDKLPDAANPQNLGSGATSGSGDPETPETKMRSENAPSEQATRREPHDPGPLRAQRPIKVPEPGEEEFNEFRRDLEAAERKVAGEIEPGIRAVVVAVAVMVVIISLILPHAGSARGLDVLTYDETARHEAIAFVSRLFVWFAVVFGIILTALALVTRRWVIAWVAVAGCAVTVVLGLLAVWTRQTPGLDGPPPSGPGIGLILGWFAMMVLTFHWVKVVWARTAYHMAVEAERREAAAKAPTTRL